MDDRLQVSVVEVEDVGAHAVDEGGVHDVESLPAAQDSRVRGGRKRGQRSDRFVDRLVMRSTDRHAHPVDEGAQPFLADRRGQLFVAGLHDVPGQFARHAGRRGRGRRRARGRTAIR